MSAVAGQGTTFNLPNYVGELFHVTPKETPFLSMIGGLSGGEGTDSKVFTWQTVDNNAAAQPAILEGADPAYESRDRGEVSNVAQIFEYGVEVSYTKQANVGQLGTPTAAATAILGDQPVQDELSFQTMLKVERAARDVEFTFLRGAFANPANNASARQTRGILTAITTNVVTPTGTPRLAKTHLDEVLRAMANSGAPFRNVVILANAFQRQRISDIYGYAPESRDVGGLSVKQIETDFGTFGVVYNRHMPTDTLLLADVSVCKPRFLTIPDKGHFFLEEKAASGASRKFMLYGEIGLEYGPELWHGEINGLATS
jgi:hypothetical protein